MVFHFVVNPAGASGRTGKQFAVLQPMLDASGAQIYVHQSTREKNIEAVCREVLHKTAGEEKVNLVIVGGDGTFNQAINAVDDFSRVRLGLVPAGSGNDLARSLGLSDKPEEVLSALERAGILGGLPVEGGVLWCATEKQSREELDRAIAIVKEVLAK